MNVDLGLLNSLSILIAGFVMVWAALSDALCFRIPNLASLILLLLFPLFCLTNPTTVMWPEHLQTFAVVLVLGYILYLKKWAGAGDIKLLSVISLWAGPDLVGPFLFITAISGGIFSLGIGLLAYVRQHPASHEGKHAWTKTPIPYGVAIALGGLCTLALLSHPERLLQG